MDSTNIGRPILASSQYYHDISFLFEIWILCDDTYLFLNMHTSSHKLAIFSNGNETPSGSAFADVISQFPVCNFTYESSTHTSTPFPIYPSHSIKLYLAFFLVPCGQYCTCIIILNNVISRYKHVSICSLYSSVPTSLVYIVFNSLYF